MHGFIWYEKLHFYAFGNTEQYRDAYISVA